MKKKLFVCLVAGISFASLVPVSSASAAGMKIGVLSWYSWWDSEYMMMRSSGKSLPLSFDNRYTINSAPLYGPLISFDIRKWSLNAVFLCGNHFRNHSSYGNISIPTYAVGLSRGVTSIFKYDLDATLTYAFTKVFRAFVGFKYHGYQFDSRGSNTGTRTLETTLDSTFDFKGLGPGLGIGVTIPLVRTLYLLWNGSGLYSRVIMIGKGTVIGAGDYSYTSFGQNSTSNYMWQRQISRGNLNGVGCNTSLTLAYLVPSASLTISLGGRYQFIRYYLAKLDVNTKAFISQNIPSFNVGYGLIQDEANGWGGRRTIHNKNDHFYGLILSFIYSIDFTRDNGGNG